MSSTMVQVPVKMGSHKMTISIANDSSMTCRDLISNVLERCKLDKQLSRTYAIFESNNGIEKKLHSKQEILQVYSQNSKTQFIVRKYMKTEKRVVEKVSSEQHQRMVKKCFKKMNQNIELQSQDRPYLTSIEQEYLKQMPKTINKRITKLEKRISTAQEIKIEKPIEEQTAKIANNINILQFLYCKLKKHNGISLNNHHQSNSSYERLVDNESCGNSTDEDDCSVGSGRSTSSLQQMI